MSQEKTIYKVVVSFTYRTEAENNQDAIDKVQAYLGTHPNEASYAISTDTVWVNSEE